jgi:hypothetical protein
MANSLKKRIGDMNLVQNTERKFGSANAYYHVRVQLPGNVEKHMLMTEAEVDDAIERAEANAEDLLKPSGLQDALD